MLLAFCLSIFKGQAECVLPTENNGRVYRQVKSAILTISDCRVDAVSRYNIAPLCQGKESAPSPQDFTHTHHSYQIAVVIHGFARFRLALTSILSGVLCRRGPVAVTVYSARSSHKPLGMKQESVGGDFKKMHQG